jgi:two-component system, cell cycle response regulator
LEHGVKVLVADDDITGRALAARWVRNWGYEVLTAADGAEALRVLEEEPSVQLAVLDWMMPGLSGVDVCRQVREKITNRYVYMVLLTGKSESDDTVLGLESGADDYMTKPCNPKELEVRLRAGRRIVELERALVHVQEQLSHEAAHDALTGLLNRRAILEELDRELVRGQRSRQPLSLVLCDVDHFKRVNDTYGHPAGDDVLRAIPSRLSGALRSYDRAGRYGGEEFLIVLSNCPEPAALGAAERIRRTLEASPVFHAGHELSVTMSLGVSSTQLSFEHGAQTLVKAADAALYRAKRSGRNRVLLATEDEYLALSAGRVAPVLGRVS